MKPIKKTEIMSQTKATIREALMQKIDDFHPEIGEDDDLNAGLNTGLTDELAGTLDSVNPNHNYPPTNK